MQQTLIRLIIAGLLLCSVVIAIAYPPQSYYPAVEIEASDAKGRLNFQFLFEPQGDLAQCEGVTGKISRVVLSNCKQCRVKSINCETQLGATQHMTLSEDPLQVPSGRMSNGIVTYEADNPEVALAACLASEAMTAGSPSPVKCYSPNTHRTKSDRTHELDPWTLALLLAGFAASWLAVWIIMRYEHLHAHLSHDHVDAGPQKYHEEPTPRIGGLAIMIGLLTAGGVMLLSGTQMPSREFGLLLLASIPAFLGGLLEDITKKVGVMERLFLTMLAGALAAWLLGAVLGRLDVPGVDLALTWYPFAVAFTVFAVGGIANAINIIDGYNGLATGVAVIVLIALAYVSHLVGDGLILATSLSLAGALLGFLFWNWPGGNIFLGDGGAYLIGFTLAELSVLLIARNPEVSPWFPLALLIYAVFETFYSIYRRKFLKKLSPGQPDNEHLHQLIHDYLVLTESRRDGKTLGALEKNNQVAKYLWGPVAVMSLLAGLFWASTPLLISCVFAFCVFYVVNYRRIEQLKKIY